MNNPKVSIIVPIYGVESYIEKCAESLFNQTYTNCEFVFVNDCTQDNSIVILKNVICKYPGLNNCIHIVSHDVNMGLAQARNTGVKAATGEYLMHVDSDDTIELNTVEYCVLRIIDTGADAVIFGMRHVTRTGERIEHISMPDSHIAYINQLIKRETIVCMCGSIYKRSLYVDNDVWAVPGLNMGEDYSTKPRLLYYAKKLLALDEPLYIYNHLNEDSYTRRFDQNRIKDIEKAISVLTNFFMNKDESESYNNSLKTASLVSKVILLKSWGISNASNSSFEMIKNLYNDINLSYINNTVDKFLLRLANGNHPILVRFVVKFGYYIKSFLNK